MGCCVPATNYIFVVKLGACLFWPPYRQAEKNTDVLMTTAGVNKIACCMLCKSPITKSCFGFV